MDNNATGKKRSVVVPEQGACASVHLGALMLKMQVYLYVGIDRLKTNSENRAPDCQVNGMKKVERMVSCRIASLQMTMIFVLCILLLLFGEPGSVSWFVA